MTTTTTTTRLADSSRRLVSSLVALARSVFAQATQQKQSPNFLSPLGRLMYIYISLSLYTSIYLCIYIYAYIYIYIHMKNTHVIARNHYSQFASRESALSRCALSLSCTYVRVCIYIRTCVYIYIYTYIIYVWLFIE